MMPLVLGANRDEFFSRPTEAAQFWPDNPDVLAGRDLQAGGTWLGITRSGRFAAVTNVREPVSSHKRSRGDLTRHFLIGRDSPEAYLDKIHAQADEYAGFNLLLGEFDQSGSSLYYFSNRQGEVQSLPPGTYGLSNHLLDSPWPKVDDGKAVLRQRLQQAHGDHTVIRDILEHPSTAEDHRLPDTGVGYQREKALSAIFITELEDYGTRTSTVLTISSDSILFSEQNYRASLDGQVNVDGDLRTFELKAVGRSDGSLSVRDLSPIGVSLSES